MSLTPTSGLRTIHGITEVQRVRIEDFLQGAVYCWCKNRKNEWFSLRDLMGGDNFHWEGTPLIAIYEKQVGAGVPDPIERAGQESGWLLKHTVAKDRRAFETRKEERIRQYRWIPNA